MVALKKKRMSPISDRVKILAESATIAMAKKSRELLAEDLRVAQQALGEITGEFSADDLLGNIFGSFCIGK